MTARVETEEQGIVTILDGELITKVPPTLRRTISADFSSSKKWLAEDEKSPMKRIASLEELTAADDSSEGDHKQEVVQLDMPNQDDVWRSIQAEKETKDLERPIQQSKSMQLHAWSSILGEKANESNDLPPPYVHPAVVKRSASALSEKSLEICTESLGSESGSDGLSSFAPSGKGDKEDEKEDEGQQIPPPPPPPRQEQEQGEETDTQVNSFQELQVAKYNYDPNKKASPRSFPPVLPSLETGGGSPSRQMNSHRKNGKLVLEAISVTQQNYFQAERQDGRLLLTLVNSPTSHEPTMQEEMKDELAEARKGSKQMEMLIEKRSSLPGGMLNVHRAALMMKMKRLTKLDNKDPTWSSKKVMEELPLAMPPRVARPIPSAQPQPPATSFNACEYFWRNKHTVVLAKGDTLSAYRHQDMVLKRGSNRVIHHSVSLSNGCQESRRSLLIWHPYRAENYSIRTMI